MVDTPLAAIVIAECWLYVKLREDLTPPLPLLAATGLLIGISAGFRYTAASFALPFAFLLFRQGHATTKKLGWLVLFAPLVLVIAVSSVYNWRTFGSPFRNGYNFWVPIPYDYWNLVFSLSYVPETFRAMLVEHGQRRALVAATAILLLACSAERSSNWTSARAGKTLWSLIVFLGVGGLPLFLFHLVYFVPDRRFFLPIQALFLVLVGGMAGRRLTGIREEFVLIALVSALAVVGVTRIASPLEPPWKRQIADRLAARTPSDAILITALDPVYLDPLVARGTNRSILPISRKVEYAGAVVAWKRIPHPTPPPSFSNWLGILNGGAKPAVKDVAVERLEELNTKASRGVPIFLDAASVGREDRSSLLALSTKFRWRVRGEMLYQLLPRPDPPRRPESDACDRQAARQDPQRRGPGVLYGGRQVGARSSTSRA